MPKRFLKICACLIMCCTVACGKVGPYRTSKLTLQQTNFSENLSKTTASSAFEKKSALLKNPWEMFNDPQLTRLIACALACNPTIHMAESRIYLACAKAEGVRAALLPHISFDANIMRRRVGEFSALFLPGLVDLFTETTIKAFNATYELDIWKKNRSLFWAALDDVQAQIAEKAEAALVIATAVGQSYFDYQIATQRHRLALALVDNKRALLGVLKEQLDQGIISAFHLYETDQLVAALQDSAAILENEIQVSLNRLNALVGNACTQGCEKAQVTQRAEAALLTPFPLPKNLPLDLLARRPEITAQKWRIEGGCHSINAAKASFYPNVNLLAFFGFQSIKNAVLLQAQSFNIMGKSALHLPIYEGGALQANLSISKEEYELAVQQYNQLILDAVQEVSDWVSSLDSATKREVLIKRSIADAEALLTLTELRFTHGVADKIALLNAEFDLLMQKDMQVQVTLAKLQSALGLIKAIGGGYHECT